MGFLDVLTGKRKIKQPAPDRLFAMSTAGVTLETELGLRSSGKAAIVFQPLGTADFEAIVAEMEELVRSTGDENRARRSRASDDKFGYRWMILADPDFEDVVVGVNAVSTELQAGGYGDRVLCAVFAFRDAQDKPVYWIYNYKRGAVLPVRPGAAASSSATPSASCACRPRSAPSCPSRASSSAGSRSGTSRSSPGSARRR